LTTIGVRSHRLKNAKFRFIEEPITRLSALKTKEIDFAVNMYPEYASELPKVFSAIGMETYWIRFNQISGVMKDKNSSFGCKLCY